VPEDDEEAYERGHVAGEIAARLAGHDKHFNSINGSLERIAEKLTILAMDVQRLADQAVSDAATRISTAAALKDAEAARRDKTEQSWSPWSKVFAVIAAVVALAGLYYLIKGK
jgi:hypothetical protein